MSVDVQLGNGFWFFVAVVLIAAFFGKAIITFLEQTQPGVSAVQSEP